MVLTNISISHMTAHELKKVFAIRKNLSLFSPSVNYPPKPLGFVFLLKAVVEAYHMKVKNAKIYDKIFYEILENVPYALLFKN